MINPIVHSGALRSSYLLLLPHVKAPIRKVNGERDPAVKDASFGSSSSPASFLIGIDDGNGAI